MTRVTQQTLVKFSDWLVLPKFKIEHQPIRDTKENARLCPVYTFVFAVVTSVVVDLLLFTDLLLPLIFSLQISWPYVKQVATRLCQVKTELPSYIPKQIVFPISATLNPCYPPYFNRKLSVPEVNHTLDEFHSENASIVFLLRTQQSPVIWDLRSRKTRTEKSHYYCDVTVFKILCVQNIFCSH